MAQGTLVNHRSWRALREWITGKGERLALGQPVIHHLGWSSPSLSYHFP
jgi:hypothetical protein